MIYMLHLEGGVERLIFIYYNMIWFVSILRDYDRITFLFRLYLACTVYKKLFKPFH